MVMGVCLRRFRLNMNVVGDVFVLSWPRVRRVDFGRCDFVVLSVVEVCVDYGSVNVFHVCLDFGVVYGVGVYVNISDVVCVLYVVCFLNLGVVFCVVM